MPQEEIRKGRLSRIGKTGKISGNGPDHGPESTRGSNGDMFIIIVLNNFLQNHVDFACFFAFYSQ